MSETPAGVVEHPMLAALGVVEAGLDALGEGNIWSLSDADLGEVLERSAAVKAPTGGAWVGRRRQPRRAGYAAGC